MKERIGGEEVEGGRGGRWGGDYFFCCCNISFVGVAATLLYTTTLPQLPTIYSTYI